MDAVQKEVLTFKRCEPKKCINASHMVGVFEILQSLRKDEVLCDIRIETNDGTIIFGHKVVLVSASPYFRAVFISFEETNKDLILISELDSPVLQLLVNYIYTGEIMVTEENVKVLLSAANFLQLDYVKSVCVEFLQSQLNPSNCLGIKAFADLHNCTELFSSSEAYIKKQFLEIVKYDEFLSLTSVEVIKLISADNLFVPLEEKALCSFYQCSQFYKASHSSLLISKNKVFECVTNWVKHKLECRNIFLPELMVHVRLSLVSKQFILEKVVDEPLIKNSPKCKDYVSEALYFHLYKSVHPFTNLQTIWNKPRQFGDLQKAILVLGWSGSMKKSSLNWYDIETDKWQCVLSMREGCRPSHLASIAEQFIFAVGSYKSKSHSVQMLDLSSQTPYWVRMPDMLVGRTHFRVCVLGNCVYVVGGSSNSAEVFDVSIEEWRMVSSMSATRSNFGIGVLNNLIYVVGGYDGSSCQHCKSVECYDPSLDTWILVAEMSRCRSSVGIGILDGVMYAIGGNNGSTYLKSVEAYTSNTGVWTTIADMNLERYNPVVALDGLLYVMGGLDKVKNILDSVEMYNPSIDTWKLMENTINFTDEMDAAIVVDRPPHFVSD
ncbi:ring canal kelch homolog isoform X2 [Myzus persicae]|uniref:ring canal kelch homolog isoform X2 n=1 Tax=Myzus persicae TaxID=13164 RepID=UPI000B936E62|nr:ring canal kelch homolog isoform X2 [Myzus persicae]